MAAFVNRLVMARKAMGMTQAELAEKTGMAKGTISAYEQGRHTPRWVDVERLAEALMVPPAALLGYDAHDPATSGIVSDAEAIAQAVVERPALRRLIVYILETMTDREVYDLYKLIFAFDIRGRDYNYDRQPPSYPSDKTL